MFPPPSSPYRARIQHRRNTGTQPCRARQRIAWRGWWRRRLAGWSAQLLIVAAMLWHHPLGLLAAPAAGTLGVVYVLYRCPRCQNHFGYALSGPWFPLRRSCAHCGLRVGQDPTA